MKYINNSNQTIAAIVLMTNPKRSNYIFDIISLLSSNNIVPQTFYTLSLKHGVLPLIYHSLKELPNKNTKIKELLELFQPKYIQIAQKNIFMSAELIRIQKSFHSAKIKALGFKGPLLAQFAYQDITLRQFNDLDILIEVDFFEDAVRILKQLGYKPSYDLNEKQLKHFLRTSHEYTMIHPNKHIVVELHWRLSSEDFLVSFDTVDLFKDMYSIDLNGYRFNSFQPEVLFVYLSVHGTKHYWERLEWLCDLAYMINTYEIQWNRVIAIATQTKSKKIILTTLYLLKLLYDIEIPKEIQTLFKKTKGIKTLSMRLEKDFLSQFEDPKHTKKLSSIQLELIEEPQHKLDYLLAFFKPTQLDYLSINLPKGLHFLYYIIRPFNILYRKLFKH